MAIIIKRTDVLFVTYYIGTLEVGFYEIALSLASSNDISFNAIYYYDSTQN